MAARPSLASHHGQASTSQLAPVALPCRRASDQKVNDCPFITMVRSDGVQALANLLTSESVQLNCALLGIQEEDDAVFSLTVSGGVAYIWYADRKVAAASVVLKQNVYLADKKPYRVSNAGGLSWLEVPVVQPHVTYSHVPVQADGFDFVCKLIELSNRANGAKWWCDLTYLWSFAHWGNIPRAQAFRNLGQSVIRWATKVGLTWDGCLWLKGGTFRFDRPLECDALSATGLLLALLFLAARRRGDHHQSQAKFQALLHAMVQQFCEVDDVPMRVTMNTSEVVDVTSPSPPVACVQMHIDRSQFFIDTTAATKKQFPWVKRFQNECSSALTDTGGYNIAETLHILFVARGSGWDLLLSQLLVNLGRFLDIRFSSMPGFQDSVKAIIAAPEAVDEDARDAMAMGECVDESRHVCPQALIKIAGALKLTPKFNVFRRWNSIAKRYFLAGRRDFGTETTFSQVLDASRFLNDSLEGVLGAVKPSEGGHEMLVAWCPPQELQQILSFGDILNLQLFTSSNSTRSCFDYTCLTFFF